MGALTERGVWFMNKKNIFIVSILLMLPLVIFIVVQIKKGITPKDIELYCSYEQYDYHELKEKADVIALIKVLDDLSLGNSTLIYNEDFETSVLAGFYSTRLVEVIEYYKDTKDLGAFISIIEPTCISKENCYIHAEGYEKLKKDNYYIVFLSDDNVSKQLSIISANNGRINISNIEENYYPDIIENAVSEFCLEQIIKEVPDVQTY